MHSFIFFLEQEIALFYLLYSKLKFMFKYQNSMYTSKVYNKINQLSI